MLATLIKERKVNNKKASSELKSRDMTSTCGKSTPLQISALSKIRIRCSKSDQRTIREKLELCGYITLRSKKLSVKRLLMLTGLGSHFKAFCSQSLHCLKNHLRIQNISNRRQSIQARTSAISLASVGAPPSNSNSALHEKSGRKKPLLSEKNTDP